MQDLYRRLGVARGSREPELDRAMRRSRDLALARDTKAVLLQPQRRRAYDRLHQRLSVIALLQARLPDLPRRNLPQDLADEFAVARPRRPPALDAFRGKLRSRAPDPPAETKPAEPVEPARPRRWQVMAALLGGMAVVGGLWSTVALGLL